MITNKNIGVFMTKIEDFDNLIEYLKKNNFEFTSDKTTVRYEIQINNYVFKIRVMHGPMSQMATQFVESYEDIKKYCRTFVHDEEEDEAVGGIEHPNVAVGIANYQIPRVLTAQEVAEAIGGEAVESEFDEDGTRLPPF